MNELRRIFIVKLRALPHVKDEIRALRWALKALLRQFGFRCVNLTEEKHRD
jgi:hypothetical protein